MLKTFPADIFEGVKIKGLNIQFYYHTEAT